MTTVRDDDRWPPPLEALASAPAIVVDAADHTPRADVGPATPSVIIGFATGANLPEPPSGCDVLVTDDDAPPWPWVGGGRDCVERLCGAIGRNPTASVVLVQLLRVGSALGPDAGLVAESLAYATLQSGAEHAAWLERRGEPETNHDGADRVTVRRDRDRLEVTLQRAEKRNAVDAAMRDALFQALELGALDPSITSVELRGEGPDFCAGGDLAEFGLVPTPAVGHLVRSARSLPRAALACSSKLTCFVQGAAVGAGIELAAFARRVVAAPDATFRLPEVAMGLIPGAGGTVSIARRIGRQRLAAMAITGDRLGTETAARWGLVDEAS